MEEEWQVPEGFWENPENIINLIDLIFFGREEDGIVS